MARSSTDFSEFDLGVGVPTGYSNIIDSNITFEVIADLTSPGEQALELTKTGVGISMLSVDAIDSDHQNGLVCWEPTNNSVMSIGLHVSDSGGGLNGYFLTANEATNTFWLQKATNGVFSDLTSSAGGRNWSSGNKYWIRYCIHRNSGDMEFRAWNDGTDEPTTWFTTTVSDITHTSGSCGVIESDPNGECIIHYMSFADSYDTPCIVLDDDMPLSGYYITCSLDNSIRFVSDDGLQTYVIFIIGTNYGLQQVIWHEVNEKLYASYQINGSIKRYDRFGLNEEDIATLADAFGITFDYDNNLIYYSSRAASSAFYSDSEDGGSQTSIVSGIAWIGHLYFNAADGFIYIPYDYAVRSYNSAGVLQRQYPTDTSDIAHWVLVDDTNVMVGYWADKNMFYRPIESIAGAWTNADGIANIWQASFEYKDKSIVVGCAYDIDVLYKWTNLPPVAVGNRTGIINGPSINTPHSITAFSATSSSNLKIRSLSSGLVMRV